MRILILGPSGQIGFELAARAEDIAEVVTAGRTSAGISLDPTDKNELENLYLEINPDIVINAIAYTAVDKAESEQEQAYLLNADLPAALADLCEKNNSLLIHYSTDFVFNGTSEIPWKEDDPTSPLSIYGKSKLAGEKAIQLSSCSSLILRTSWVYGERGGNFLLTMLRFARERESLSVVDDQIGSPSCSRDIARTTLALCQQYIDNPEQFITKCGLYHLTSRGETSWYNFAKTIFEHASQFESLAINELIAIPSNDYPTAAIRPAYSVLDGHKIKQKFNIEMPAWEESLKQCISRYYL